MVACACALLIFATATPALAFGNSSSKASDGLESLDGVRDKSENAAASGAKSSANSTSNVSKNATAGLNGVQGAANKEDMLSPEDANGTTVEDAIEDALEAVTP